MTEPQWAERSDWSPLAWGNHIKAAQLKVKVDARLGRATPDWVRELAAKDLPGLERPSGAGSPEPRARVGRRSYGGHPDGRHT